MPALRASCGSAPALVAALALAFAGTARAAGKPVVAVLPLRVLGVSPEDVRTIEQALDEAVAALPEVRQAKREAVLSSLQREPDCTAQIACAAGAAARAGARQLILGTIGILGDTYTLDLKLLDARTGQELRRATHPVSGREARLVELVRASVVELLAHDRYVGSLDVQVANDADEVAKGAQLYLDGKLRGELPLRQPLAGIPCGQHTLRVAKAGFLDATLFVDVRYGETAEARLDLAGQDSADPGASAASGAAAAATGGASALSPRPAGKAVGAKGSATPPPPFVLSTGPLPEPADPWLKIAGWSGVGVGVAAIVTGIAFHTKAFSTAATLNQRSAANQLTAADLPSYDDVASEMRTARILYLVGGVTAATGATLLIWDRVEHDKVEVSAGPLPRGGGALSLSGRF